jgi:hypothetical protein
MLQPRPDGRSQISKQLCSPRPSEADAVNESQQKTSLLRLLSLVRERNKPASAPYGMRRTNELLELYVLAKLITKPPGILELSTTWRSESLRRRRQSRRGKKFASGGCSAEERSRLKFLAFCLFGSASTASRTGAERALRFGNVHAARIRPGLQTSAFAARLQEFFFPIEKSDQQM